MPDLEQLSDDQLANIAGVTLKSSGSEEFNSSSSLSGITKTQGANCGDALAKYLNSTQGFNLPRGGIGPSEVAELGHAKGAAVYSKGDLSMEALTPGTIIHLTRQPGDRNYEYGSTHIGIIDQEGGNPVFRSYTAGKGWRSEQVNQNFIDRLPNQIVATNPISPGANAAPGMLDKIGDWLGPNAAEAAGPAGVAKIPGAGGNLEAMSDQDLAKIAGVKLEDRSDEDLSRIAGVKLKPQELTDEEKHIEQGQFMDAVGGADLGFGMSPVGQEAQPGALYQGVREMLGLNKEPWHPGPAIQKEMQDFLKQPSPGLAPAFDPKSLTTEQLAFAAARGLQAEDVPGAFGDWQQRQGDAGGELLRVMGRYVDGYTANLTEGAKKAAFGDTFMPQTPWGTAAGQGAELAGQIMGPFKLIKWLTGGYLFPSVEGLRTTSQILTAGMKEGAVNLGLLQGLSRVVPAMIENEDFSKWAGSVISSTKDGALVGLAFPMLSLIPGQGVVGAGLRMATGFAAMDYLRAAPGKWSTLGDFTQAFQTWDEESKKQFASLSYQYLLDLYFANSVRPIRETMAAYNQNQILEAMTKLQPKELEKEILAVRGQQPPPELNLAAPGGPPEAKGTATVETPQTVKDINPDVVPSFEGPQTAESKGFKPSPEWQALDKDLTYPPGGEFRMDFATGKNQGRWPVEGPQAGTPAPLAGEVQPEVQPVGSAGGGTQPGASGEARALPSTAGLEVQNVPTEAIKTDPERFQYKGGADETTGAGLALGDVKTWDEGLSGVLTLWKSPEGELFAVNGHQRLDLAKRTGTGQVRAQILDSSQVSDVQARGYGAKINIAEGRGTEIDAAKFMRDMQLTPQDLADQGISLAEAKTRRAVALAQLSDTIFHFTATKQFPVEKAVIIGEELHDNQPAQDALFKTIRAWERSGKQLDGNKLRELILLAKSAGTVPGKQINLFGEAEIKKSLMLETADLLENAKKELRLDKSLFGKVGKEADRLSRAKNVIDPETNQAISQESADSLDALNRFAYIPDSATRKVIDDFARQLSTSKDKSAIRKASYEAIKSAISEDRARFGLDAGNGPGAGGKEPGTGRNPLFGIEPGAAASGEVQTPPVESALPPGVKEFQDKFGTAHGVKPDVGISAQEGAGPTEWSRPQIIKALKADKPVPPEELAKHPDLVEIYGSREALMHSGGPDTSTLLGQLRENVAGAGERWQAVKDNIRETVAPASLLKGEQRTVGQALVTMMNRKDEAIKQAGYALMDFRKLFERTPPAEWGKIVSAWQRGEKSGTDLDRAYELFHEINEALVPQISEYKDLPYQENYLRQAWKNSKDVNFRENVGRFQGGDAFKNYHDLNEAGNPRIYRAKFDEKGGYELEKIGEGAGGKPTVPEVAGEGYGYGRTLTGGRSYFQAKKIPDYETGMMLGGQPKFKNLFDLMMFDIGEKNQFIWGNKLMQWAYDHDYLKVTLSTKMPFDWQEVKDPTQRISFTRLMEIQEAKPFDSMPADYDMTAPGAYKIGIANYVMAAPKDAARIFNNWLSPGLRGNAIYDLYRDVVDPVRRIGVAFSTFHLRFTMNNSLATGTGQALSKAMGDLIAGDMAGVAKAVKDGALNLTGAKFISQLREGKALAEALYKGSDDPILQGTLRRFIDTGGTLPPPESMRPIIKNMGEALWTGLVNLNPYGGWHPFRALMVNFPEAGSTAIMTHTVPFAKLGGFGVLDRALSEKLDAKYEKLAAASSDKAQELAAQQATEYTNGLFDINKHLDNIYGQMNYDALLINKTVKDLLFFVIKYPGWNIGSGRWMAAMAGGLKHTLTPGQQASVGEQEAMRMGLGLVVNMGIYSSLMYWFINGEAPPSIPELYSKGIWTGGYTRGGNKEYIRDASYWRDLWGMTPVNQQGGIDPTKPLQTVKAKLQDIWRIPIEIFDNKEAYSGNQIFTPGHPEDWGGQAGNYFGKQVVPYSFRGMYQAGTAWGKYGSFGGFTPTPARLTDTPALQELRSYREAETKTMVTVQKQGQREVKRNLMDFAYEGDGQGFIQALRQARAAGEVTHSQYKNLVQDGHEIIQDPHYGPLRVTFRKLSDLGEAIKVYGLATPDEREALRKVMMTKWGGAQPETRRKYRGEFMDLKARIEAGQ